MHMRTVKTHFNCTREPSDPPQSCLETHESSVIITAHTQQSREHIWLFDMQSMAWLGQKIVLCTSLRYTLLHPTQGTSTQLFTLAEDAPSPTLVQSIPSANLAVLLMVRLGPAFRHGYAGLATFLRRCFALICVTFCCCCVASV